MDKNRGLADVISALMDEVGASAGQVSQKTSIPVATVRRYRNSAEGMTYRHLTDIAGALGVRASHLARLAENP